MRFFSSHNRRSEKSDADASRDGSRRPARKTRHAKLFIFRFSDFGPSREKIRPGTTLVELLLFLAILGVVGFMVIPLLFSVIENRLLQQTVSITEQNGNQILQNLSLTVSPSEKIILPLQGHSGSVLALQSGSGANDPTLIGTSGGILIVIRRNVRQNMSTSQVGVENFVVRNTSQSGSGQSVLVQFDVSRSVRLQSPRVYMQHFQTVYQIFPADVPKGNACNCPAPACSARNVMQWQMCDATNGSCPISTIGMDCP